MRARRHATRSSFMRCRLPNSEPKTTSAIRFRERRRTKRGSCRWSNGNLLTFTVSERPLSSTCSRPNRLCFQTLTWYVSSVCMQIDTACVFPTMSSSNGADGDTVNQDDSCRAQRTVQRFEFSLLRMLPMSMVTRAMGRDKHIVSCCFQHWSNHMMSRVRPLDVATWRRVTARGC